MSENRKIGKADREKIMYFLNKENDIQHQEAKLNFDRKPFYMGGTYGGKKENIQKTYQEG